MFSLGDAHDFSVWAETQNRSFLLLSRVYELDLGQPIGQRLQDLPTVWQSSLEANLRRLRPWDAYSVFVTPHVW